jgi:glycosyltransferase involved in cell wall biosynthesis
MESISTPDVAATRSKHGVTPQITTVIPTYRRPQLLQRAIISAVEQDGADGLVAVFDNCSGDETSDVVAALAQRYPQVRYYRHPRNLGATANFEFGVRSVDTPFFSILSDDDYLLPDFYRHALAGLAANPEAMFWVGVTLNVDERGTIWDARVDRWPRAGMYYPPEGAMAMTGGRAPLWTGVVFRSEVLERAGFIDPETAGPADLDYLLRLGARFPYLLEKIPVAVFTLNSEGFSATQPLSSFWPGWVRMFRNVQTLPDLHLVDRERLLAALHADARRMLFRRGINALSGGRRDYAREAADALVMHYSQRIRAAFLRGLAFGCERIPGVQSILSQSYQMLERRIVRSRQGLQGRYGHLLRRD